MNKFELSLTERSIKLYASIYFLLFYGTVIFLWAKGFAILQYVTFFSAIGMLGVLGLLEFVIKKSDKSQKKIWRLIQVSSLLYAVGDLITEYYLWLDRTIELDGIYNIFYLISTSILILALILLGFQNSEKNHRLTLTIDIGIVTISLITASWGIYIYPILVTENVNAATFLFSIWYLLTDIGLLTSIYLLYQVINKLYFPIKFIIIGVSIYIISDIFNMAEIATNQNIISLLLYPGWVAAQYLIAYSGIRDKKEIESNSFEKEKIPIIERTITYTPYFSLIILAILIAIYCSEKNIVTIGATICSIIFIIKQLFIIFDNTKMVKMLGVLNEEILVKIDILNMENREIEKKKETEIKDSLMDSFTGVYNRKYLAEYIERFNWDAESDFAVLMVDIDNLKGINDSYGHLAGDLVITGVTKIMQVQNPSGISIIRLGGDEFMLLMERANATKGYLMAERIRSEVEETLFDFQGQLVNCSVSIGIAERTVDDENFNAVVIKADKALYDAKSKGRNKSEIYIASSYENNDSREDVARW